MNMVPNAAVLGFYICCSSLAEGFDLREGTALLGFTVIAGYLYDFCPSFGVCVFVPAFLAASLWQKEKLIWERLLAMSRTKWPRNQKWHVDMVFVFIYLYICVCVWKSWNLIYAHSYVFTYECRPWKDCSGLATQVAVQVIKGINFQWGDMKQHCPESALPLQNTSLDCFCVCVCAWMWGGECMDLGSRVWMCDLLASFTLGAEVKVLFTHSLNKAGRSVRPWEKDGRTPEQTANSK